MESRPCLGFMGGAFWKFETLVLVLIAFITCRFGQLCTTYDGRRGVARGARGRMLRVFTFFWTTTFINKSLARCMLGPDELQRKIIYIKVTPIIP